MRISAAITTLLLCTATLATFDATEVDAQIFRRQCDQGCRSTCLFRRHRECYTWCYPAPEPGGCGTCILEYDPLAGDYVWSKNCNFSFCKCSIQFTEEDPADSKRAVTATGDCTPKQVVMRDPNPDEFYIEMFPREGMGNDNRLPNKKTFIGFHENIRTTERKIRIQNDQGHKQFTKWLIEIAYDGGEEEGPVASTAATEKPTGRHDKIRVKFPGGQVATYYFTHDGNDPTRETITSGRFSLTIYRAFKD